MAKYQIQILELKLGRQKSLKWQYNKINNKKLK